MWMRRLDKQKFIFIALWITRAMLNHLTRIHSPHCSSLCISHERHYDFLPQVLSFVLFPFLCHVTSTQKVLVRGETGGPKTCFTSRSSSYSDTYVVKGSYRIRRKIPSPCIDILLQT
ncbi:hypothetical protein ARMGADRAFT_624845 [Armillaria gallica]|uniref:Uncharacterized protein n=1 Tax=Armillaria gallica TaxID=47427 RepID=A0A2H3CQ50_ARMGA|nr:hypothetical protein ARMGADRAFT_624845 [Armillaria gallica]